MSDDILRDLIDGEREELVPPRGAKKKTWRRVSSSVAMGAPLPADPTMVSTPMLAAKSALPWAKGLVVLALGGVVGLGAYAAGGSDGDDGAPPVVDKAAAAAPPAPQEPVAAPGPKAPAVEPPVIAPTEAEPVAVPEPFDATANIEPPSPQAPTPVARDTDEPEPSQLAEETRLIAAARRSLRNGSPRAALKPLTDHAERFANGQLAEDRMALIARAHCEAGDVKTGLEKAAALGRAFPSSSHMSRVERACETD